jgi:hypothetical protein
LRAVNPHTRWRLELARQIAGRLRGYSGIQAILVGGSVARGFADTYSDLEIPIIWEELPGDATRQAITVDLGADFLYPFNGPAREDNLLIKGFQVDLWHNSVANDEEVIRRVLQEYSTDLGDSNFMDTLRHCIPLYGQDLVSRWKEMAAQYPAELAARNIDQGLQGIDLKQLHLAVQRDNPVLYIQTLAAIQFSLFSVWLALNRCYYPTLKWIFPTLETFQLLPGGAAARLKMISTAPHQEGAVEICTLVTETLDLVEQHSPQIDVATARRKISWLRAEMVDRVEIAKPPGEKL